MSRTGLTTLQMLLSKAKIYGVKRFLAASVPIPVTHTQNPLMTGWFQCPGVGAAAAIFPEKDRTCAWTGLGEVGSSELWQEGHCKMGTEAGHEPDLCCRRDGVRSLLWGRGLCGAGEDWAAPFPFPLRAAEPHPGHSQESSSVRGSGDDQRAPQGRHRESWALAVASAPEVGAEDSRAQGLTAAQGWRREEGGKGSGF